MTTSAFEQKRPAAPSFDLTGKRVVVIGGKRATGLGTPRPPGPWARP